MKKKIILVFLLALIISRCKDPSINFTPVAEQEEILVPDVIEVEESINDPQVTGAACVSNSDSTNVMFNPIDSIEIPNDLPVTHDLSEDMPPVRSQGNQGSCVAWATAYYLKSYQEKIQGNYDYNSYEDVMSPSFVYNQTKSNINCMSGSSISRALELLKTQGVSTWKEFPYTEEQCSRMPSEELIISSGKNKIKEYYSVQIPESNTDENYTLINLVKTLIYQKQPVVISLDWKDIVFEEIDNETVATSFSLNPTDECGHAVLLVGYDDEMNAFKIVNSWGTSWGNKGYAWVDYKFFLPTTDEDFIEGLNESYVTFDEDKEDE